MKNTWLVALLVAAAVPAFGEDAGTLGKIKASGVITLGVRDASIPFSFLDDKQEAVGYSVDLCMKVVEAVKRSLKMPNLEVKKQVVTSANRIPLIANGTVDLECGSTVNNIERQKIVNFSITTFLVNTKFIAKKSSNIHALKDLKGKTVSVTAGTNTLGKILDINKAQNLDLTIIQGKDHPESFLYVETGRTVAFAEDDILLAGLAANSKTPNEFNLVAIDGMLADPYSLMLGRDDPAFKKVVDDTLRHVFSSGEIFAIYDKWFAKPIPPRGVTMNFPQSEQWKRIVAHPTDSPDPKDYR
ncbi:MAG TPA: amino acid ABC transporter substrate-binding protein [Usitatibacter sp.]|jgi:glutamate/aspartate transport system substrate-binding protein|nr:amino acid ABC transporter substrate-binding protein [Usitatibacter sp.]